MSKIIEFDGPLFAPEASPKSGAVVFPFDLKETFGKKTVKVKMTFDGIPYRGLLKSMGGDGVYCLIRKEIRNQLGKQPGEVIHVTVQEDFEERVVDVPQELQQLLDEHPNAKAIFEKLSYTNRKEYVQWINDAKRETTKTSRLEKIIPYILDGRKNPSQT